MSERDPSWYFPSNNRTVIAQEKRKLPRAGGLPGNRSAFQNMSGHPFLGLKEKSGGQILLCTSFRQAHVLMTR